MHDAYQSKNYYIETHNLILDEVVGKFKEMEILQLHTWDKSAMTQLLPNNEFSSTGLKRFWMAIDDAFKEWDKVQMKAAKDPKPKSTSSQLKSQVTKVKHEDHNEVASSRDGHHTSYRQAHYDHFHWVPEMRHHLLPPPPSRHHYY